ncbi:MAG: PQQ-binding-like beta-propeller repeat protein [Ferruginibacter sp.]
MKTLKYNPLKTSTLFFYVIIIATLITSCTKTNGPLAFGDKAIISFKIIKSNGVLLDTASVHVEIRSDSIFFTVPAATDITNLTPVIEIKGVSLSPASGVPQDFSSPVKYTVKGSDGSSRVYTVMVKRAIDNYIFFGASNKIMYALDAVDGHLIWSYTSNGWFSYSSPTVWQNIVYAGSTDNSMYAFDAATGKVLWTFATNQAIESSPAIANGILYFGSDDNSLYAVDALTGKLKWTHATGFNIGSSPTIVNGAVYVGSDDFNLYAFDAVTGNVKWTFTAGSIFNASSPVVVDGVLFIGNRDGNLYAIDAATGSLKWKYYNGGISMEQSSPTVNNGVVYIGGWYNISNFSIKGSVYAVNAQTGKLLWKALDSLAFGSSPVIAGGNLYIAADDLNLYSLNASTGNINWKVQIIPNGASPAIADGVVYVGGGGTGYYYALDAATGKEKWKYPIPMGLSVSSPCIIGVDGSVYHPGVSGEYN